MSNSGGKSGGGLTEKEIKNLIKEKSPVRPVDLGVIDFAKVFSEGPQTLYTMAAGDFLRAIRWVRDGYEAPPAETYGVPVVPGVGTRASFAWWAFASETDEGSEVQDTNYLGQGGQGIGASGASAASMVLSPASDGPIEAAWFHQPSGGSGSGKGVRYAGITAWKAATHYDSLEGPSATPKLAAIIANGRSWINVGEEGTSGEAEPAFTEPEEPDGANIVWKNINKVPVTTGKQHAVAEIWTPA